MLLTGVEEQSLVTQYVQNHLDVVQRPSVSIGRSTYQLSLVRKPLDDRLGHTASLTCRLHALCVVTSLGTEYLLDDHLLTNPLRLVAHHL